MIDLTESDDPVWILGIRYVITAGRQDDSQVPPIMATTTSSLSDKLWKLATGGSGSNSGNNSAENSPNSHALSLEEQEYELFFRLQREALMNDFITRIWFTYRKDFEPITNYRPSKVAEMFSKSANSYFLPSKNNDNHNPPSPISMTSKNSSEPPSPTLDSAVYYIHSPESKSKMTKLYQSFSCYTSDAGWGCMMRSGQMLLAQAYLHYFCGREFRLNSHEDDENHRRIISWFADEESAPYSIHRFALAGTLIGKKVGEWFGPTDMSNVLMKLVACHQGDHFLVHIAEQGGIYINEIVQKCTQRTKQIPIKEKDKESTKELDEINYITEHLKSFEIILPSSDNLMHSNQSASVSNNMAAKKQELNGKEEHDNDNFWRPVVILIPLRLGLDSLNPIYEASLHQIFEIPQTLGIVGGRPRSSLYFIGYQGDHVIYLDPHIVQKKSSDLSTYHCKVLRRMKMSDIDPSLVIGFLCKDRKDFDELIQYAQKLADVKNPIWCVLQNKSDIYCPPTTTPTEQKNKEHMADEFPDDEDGFEHVDLLDDYIVSQDDNPGDDLLWENIELENCNNEKETEEIEDGIIML
jgi:cysteine protease ATG4